MKKLVSVLALAAVSLSFVASAAEQAVAVGTPDGKLVFYYDEASHSEGTVYSVALAESMSQPPWYSDRANFTNVVTTIPCLILAYGGVCPTPVPGRRLESDAA